MKTKFLSPMTPTKAAIALLEDAKIYLYQLSPTAYCKILPLLFNSNIGQHSRHFIEFFQCLMIQSQQKDGVINYDLRKRNKRIEQEPQYAIETIDHIIEELPHCISSCDLQLETTYDPNTNDTLTVSTCFDRELLYNIEHTIHHLAIIKIGLQLVMPNIELPSHFGFAPSTVKYRAELVVSA